MTNRRNERFMHLVRHVHGLLENDDMQHQRTSQNQLGNLIKNNKNYTFLSDDMNSMHGEWTKYVHGKHDHTIIFYCHGGGYMSGSTLYARSITTKLAKHTLHDVFSFDYRLAPEHPYPCAIEDAFLAWNYILSKGYTPENIIVAGDSAGGNLALVLTLLLTERHMELPKCLVLFSPWTDMTSSGNSYHTKAELDPVLNTEYISKAIQYYLGNTNPSIPYVSPLFADFSSFPPVYIQVGENEILLDDSVMLHKHLLASNVYTKLEFFQGMWHVFQMTPIPYAEDAIRKVNDFLSQLPK